MWAVGRRPPTPHTPHPTHFEYSERLGLAWCCGNLGDAVSHERVQQARFADVGATEERDFGERGVERGVGARKRTDETRVGQASFFCRTRSVTSSGVRLSRTLSAVMHTSRTSSRLRRSEKISLIISPRVGRGPRAPGPRLFALWGGARHAALPRPRPPPFGPE